MEKAKQKKRKVVETVETRGLQVRTIIYIYIHLMRGRLGSLLLLGLRLFGRLVVWTAGLRDSNDRSEFLRFAEAQRACCPSWW